MRDWPSRMNKAAAIPRKHDWWRLAALVPLFLIAAIGQSRLKVDVENLAMKSTGTEIAKVAALCNEQFGANPRLILLATPREEALAPPISDGDVDEWTAQLKSREEVIRADEAPQSDPNIRCFSIELRAEDDGRYAETVRGFTRFAKAALPASHTLAISGFPVIEIAIAESLAAEQRVIIPALILALALILSLVYRSPALVLGALVAPLSALFLLEGVEGLAGLAIDPISGLLGPTILTVGVATSVHVLERFRLELKSGSVSVEAASASAAAHLRVPFVLALCTTLAGFMGLLANPIPAVRRFGMLASLGVLFATTLALFILPCFLRLFYRRPKANPGKSSFRSSLTHARITRLFAIPIVILLAAAISMAASHLGDSQVDNDLLDVLAEHHQARLDTSVIADQLGGSQTVELLLPPDDTQTSPMAIPLLMQSILELDAIVAPAAVPRTSPAGFTLLSFVMAPGGSSEHTELFENLTTLVVKRGWEAGQVTGLAAHIAKDSNALVKGQRDGIFVTALGLWLVMAIGFRSWWMALLGLVPNLLPLVLINGTMIAMGQPLTVASSMIGTVMLGLVVDDTIHWLHSYGNASGSTLRRISRAFFEVRRAIVITTIVLAVGFSATLLGELPSTREFGMLAVATLIIALVADLFLLPALILLFGRIRVFVHR
ncbi:MAG: putative RND superfamily exporter protein [Planctomycetota bacterium]|jgi:predicted RND superfamily exporter protein